MLLHFLTQGNTPLFRSCTPALPTCPAAPVPWLWLALSSPGAVLCRRCPAKFVSFLPVPRADGPGMEPRAGATQTQSKHGLGQRDLRRA